MLKNDKTTMQAADLSEAIALMTRLPVTSSGARGAAAAWAWPIAGALVALPAALLGLIALSLGLPAPVAAGLALATQIILTGALHEDGLADCADGFWGGHIPEARLGIMRDSHIGTYGTIAITLTLGFRWLLLAALFEAGTIFAPLIAAAALSRVPMVAIMAWLAPARSDGLSASTGQPSRDTVTLAATTGLLIALLCTGLIALTAAPAAALSGWLVARLARAKINGQTGDVLGASQQLAEIAILATLAAIAS